MAFTLPDLPYDHDALEPYVDARTMQIHHGKHHQGYTNKLNNAIEGTKWESMSAEDILRHIDEVPDDIRTAVRNNGGGYVNHKLFWTVMSPDGGGEPSGALAAAIEDTFGSLESFMDTFSSTAGSQFGSGWGWLVVDGDGNLHVYSTPNQDSPYMKGHIPILGVDVWEHAYYLHYQNKRGDYLSNWWNVVNWDQVAENYAAATQ